MFRVLYHDGEDLALVIPYLRQVPEHHIDAEARVEPAVIGRKDVPAKLHPDRMAVFDGLAREESYAFDIDAIGKVALGEETLDVPPVLRDDLHTEDREVGGLNRSP